MSQAMRHVARVVFVGLCAFLGGLVATLGPRWTGTVSVYVAGKRAGDEVVFGEPGDLTLLGSRTLEGLNFRVEPVTKQLVDAGPAPAAVLVTA